MKGQIVRRDVPRLYHTRVHTHTPTVQIAMCICSCMHAYMDNYRHTAYVYNTDSTWIL